MQNILIDKDGYIKLSDFGTAVNYEEKLVNDKIGSPNTWAPEVFKEETYRNMPDWWSCGMVLY